MVPPEKFSITGPRGQALAKIDRLQAFNASANGELAFEVDFFTMVKIFHSN